MFSNPTFWVGVSFAIFIALALKMGAGTAMIAALDGRGKKVADDLAEARRLREEAEKLLVEYEGKRKAAEAEAAAIIAAAKDEAERLAKEAEVKLAEFVVRRTKTAEEKISQAEAQATAEVRAAAADVAVRAAESILRKQVSGKTAADLVAQGLKDVKAQLN